MKPESYRCDVALSRTECGFALRPSDQCAVYTAFKGLRAKTMNYLGAYTIHLMTLQEKWRRKEVFAQRIYARILEDGNCQLTDSEKEELHKVERSALIFTAFRNFQQYKLMDANITKEGACFVIGNFALLEDKNRNGFEVRALNGANPDDIFMPLVRDEFEAPKESTVVYAVNKHCGKTVIAPEYWGCSERRHHYDHDTHTILISNQRSSDSDTGLLSQYEHEFQPKPIGHLTAFASTVVRNLYCPHDKASDSLPSVEKFRADSAKGEERQRQATKHIKYISKFIECRQVYQAKLGAMTEDRIEILELGIQALNVKYQRVKETGVSLYWWAFWRSSRDDLRDLRDKIELKKIKKKGIIDFKEKLQANNCRVEDALRQVVNEQPKDSRLFERRTLRRLGVKSTMCNNCETARFFRAVQQEENQYLAQESKRHNAISVLRQTAASA